MTRGGPTYKEAGGVTDGMADEALLFLVILLFAVVAPLVLWRLVEAERDDGPATDRGAAERTARRDTRDESRR